jgi:hypothetical protein
MKSILKYVVIFAIVLIITPLAACTSTVNTTSNTTTTTTSTIPPTPLPTVAPPDTKFYNFPDSGLINLEGHVYYYQRVYVWGFSGPSLYRDVVFNNIDTGTTIYTGGYRPYTVTFKDGTVEDLIFGGTLTSPSWYKLTQHTNPQAGILFAQEDHDWVMYVLVSVE